MAPIDGERAEALVAVAEELIGRLTELVVLARGEGLTASRPEPVRRRERPASVGDRVVAWALRRLDRSGPGVSTPAGFVAAELVRHRGLGVRDALQARVVLGELVREGRLAESSSVAGARGRSVVRTYEARLARNESFGPPPAGSKTPARLAEEARLAELEAARLARNGSFGPAPAGGNEARLAGSRLAELEAARLAGAELSPADSRRLDFEQARLAAERLAGTNEDPGLADAETSQEELAGLPVYQPRSAGPVGPPVAVSGPAGANGAAGLPEGVLGAPGAVSGPAGASDGPAGPVGGFGLASRPPAEVLAAMGQRPQVPRRPAVSERVEEPSAVYAGYVEPEADLSPAELAELERKRVEWAAESRAADAKLTSMGDDGIRRASGTPPGS